MTQGNMFLRNDTIFGVCQAIGEDFGFNPNILRVAFILPLFWFPLQMVALYAGLGLVVIATRLLFKAPADKAAANAAPVALPPANEDSALRDAA